VIPVSGERRPGPGPAARPGTARTHLTILGADWNPAGPVVKAAAPACG